MSIVVSKTRLPVTQWQTESGSVVSVANARRRDAKSAIVTLEPIQDTSGGDPSPTNLCPISGHSSVTAVRDGKNLLSPTLYTGVSYNPTVGADWSNRSVSVNQFTANADKSVYTVTLGSWASRAMFVQVQPNTAYKLKATLSGEDCATTYGWLDENNLVLTKFNTTGATVALTPSLTSPNNAKWFYLLIAPRSRQQTLTFTEPQFEQSASASAYESFQGTSITVSLGQTVYGGSVDLVSGVGTLTMANIASYNGETIGEPWLSSMDKYVAGATPTTGAQVVYTLATPITFQLTPTQLAMLERNNTIWADEGEISLTYARIRQ